MKKLLFIIFAMLIVSGSFSQCRLIQKSVDKFTGEITFKSPITEKGYYSKTNPVIFYKFIKEKDTTFYMRLTTYGNTLAADPGVMLIYRSGEKKSYPSEKVDYDAHQNLGWEYNSWIKLSKEDILKIQNDPISDFRLYIHDQQINKKQQELYAKYIGCILEAK